MTEKELVNEIIRFMDEKPDEWGLYPRRSGDFAVFGELPRLYVNCQGKVTKGGLDIPGIGFFSRRKLIKAYGRLVREKTMRDLQRAEG